jgi:sulfite exporter TauE/SafE
MCGSFVAATYTPESSHPVRMASLTRSAALPMHTGRLASYAIAGMLAGAVGATPAMLIGSAHFHAVLFSLAALVLVLTGLRIAGVDLLPLRSPGFMESLFRRTAGRMRRIGPFDTPVKRAALGILWGWAPCALVYSALPIALVSGSPAAGALVMLAFGAGTLPALLGAGWLVGQWNTRFPGPLARRAAGIALIVLAIASAAQALGVADTALGAYCVSPAH